MKKLIILSAALIAAGCDDSDDYGHDDGVVLFYANGHPLALPAPVSWEEAALEDLINNHRVAAGLDALILYLPMEDVARGHSLHMNLHFFVGIANPEGDGPSDRADLAGISHVSYGEIVGQGPSDPVVMFDAFLATPAHDFIDDPLWTHMGAGTDAGAWTVDFAWK